MWPTVSICLVLVLVAVMSMVAEPAFADREKGGACENNADKAAWESKKSLMSSDLDRCGRQCWGGASCVSSCMQTLNGYSTPCANCFGDLVQCTKSNCMSKCFAGRSDPCVQCTKEYCTPEFSECSGIPMDDIPDESSDENVDVIVQ